MHIALPVTYGISHESAALLYDLYLTKCSFTLTNKRRCDFLLYQKRAPLCQEKHDYLPMKDFLSSFSVLEILFYFSYG